MRATNNRITELEAGRRHQQSLHDRGRRQDYLSERQFLRDTEAAQFLGLSVATIRYWRLVGGGPQFSRLGRSIRYDLNDLLTFAKSRLGGGEPVGATR